MHANLLTLGREPEEVAAAVEEAEEAEFFQTPSFCVEALLCGDGPRLPGGIWLDPCAGLGRIPRAVGACRNDVRWLLCELRDECRRALETIENTLLGGLVVEDFLSELPGHARWPRADVVIFNSPFTMTQRFVERAWSCGSWVVSLQRQSWIGPARTQWLREHMPDRYGLFARPSFRADNKTDGCEYEWHVWPPGSRRRRQGISRMLTPHGLQLELFS